MRHISVIASCLFAGSAFAAACSGFSSSSETNDPSDAGDDGGVSNDTGSTVDADSATDTGVIAPGLDDAGCPTEMEQADAANRVFVTDELSSGDLGGVVGANDKCQSIGSLKYGGNWHAWVSTSACPVWRRFRTRERFLVQNGSVGSMGPDSPPSSPLAATNLRAWTGTKKGGVASGLDCAGWTSGDASLSGTQGNAASTKANSDDNWTNVETVSCGDAGRLYCFEL